MDGQAPEQPTAAATAAMDPSQMAAPPAVEAPAQEEAPAPPMAGNEAAQSGKSHFFAKLHAFQRERGEDTDPPTFAKRIVDQYRLWIAVQEAGGHAEVTGNKGWARIGRLFDPPRTMTDLSFRIKKIYETNLLPFEMAVAAGSVKGVYVPPRAAPPAAPPSAPKPSRPRPKRSAAASTPPPGSATPTATASGGATGGGAASEPRPKRAKREARRGASSELLGKRIRVLWPDEQQFFSGTVAAYDAASGLHRVDYDDGDEESLDLAKQTWHLLPDLPPGGEAALDGAGLGRLHSAAEALAAAPQAAREGGGAEGCVASGDGYKVFQTREPPGFEAFCLAPGLGIQDIKVQCWDSGRLLVSGRASEGAQQAWGGGLRHKIRLPARVHARSAKALLTLHGQLYIRVLCQPPPPPPEAVQAARAAADRLLGQEPAGEQAQPAGEQAQPQPQPQPQLQQQGANEPLQQQQPAMESIEKQQQQQPPQEGQGQQGAVEDGHPGAAQGGQPAQEPAAPPSVSEAAGPALAPAEQLAV